MTSALPAGAQSSPEPPENRRGIGAALIDRGRSRPRRPLPCRQRHCRRARRIGIRMDRDVSVEGIGALIDFADDCLGGIDLYFANAGIIGPAMLGEDDADWDSIIDVNMRAHIRAAQALVPRWQEAGSGYFVATASAAGLLTQIGSAAYSVTKHASVGFAEWLAMTYRDDGIRASVICPMGVNTNLLDDAGSGGGPAQKAVTSAGTVLEPAEVATIVLDAVEDEQFLILPHPEVLEMYRMKGSDYDRWLRGMSRYQARLNAE